MNLHIVLFTLWINRNLCVLKYLNTNYFKMTHPCEVVFLTVLLLISWPKTAHSRFVLKLDAFSGESICYT